MRVVRVVAIAGGILLGVYVFGVGLFWHRFPFQTYVNDVSVCMQTPEEVALMFLQDTNFTQFTFVGRDDTKERVLFSQLGIYNPADVTANDFPLEPFQWIKSLFSPTKYSIEQAFCYDEDKLKEKLASLSIVTSPKGRVAKAAVVDIEADGSVVVEPAVYSSEIDMDALYRAVCDALSAQTLTIDLEEAGCYIADAAHPVDLKTERTMSEILDHEVTLDMGGGVQVVMPDELLKQIAYEDAGVVYLDYSLLDGYVSYLARTYDTVGKPRKFATSGGETITLAPTSRDNFLGWKLQEEQTLSALATGLLSGDVSNSIEAVWTSKGKVHDGLNDIGTSYIEISIAQQHMWLYLDGELFCDTDVTTGLDTDGMRTPTGLFRTLDFNKEYTMRGSYGSAFCHYFIRLTLDGIGIHDASWRSQYGGDVYLTDGSHGCINTPYEIVDKLFRKLQADYTGSIPVVIY